MNVYRFSVVIVVLLVVVVAIAAIRLYSSFPAPATCSAFQQEVVLNGFKGDAVVFGILAALAAGVAYVAMLRLQIYFPTTDIARVLTAAGGGALLGLALAFGDYFLGSECLARALGPSSSMPESIASTFSVAGKFVGQVWLAIWVDHLLMAFVVVGFVRLYRELSLRLF